MQLCASNLSRKSKYSFVPEYSFLKKRSTWMIRLKKVYSKFLRKTIFSLVCLQILQFRHCHFQITMNNFVSTHQLHSYFLGATRNRFPGTAFKRTSDVKVFLSLFLGWPAPFLCNSELVLRKCLIYFWIHSRNEGDLPSCWNLFELFSGISFSIIRKHNLFFCRMTQFCLK